MAHELESVNGQTAFATLRQPAWHGLGTVFTDEVNTNEMLKLATEQIERLNKAIHIKDITINNESITVIEDILKLSDKIMVLNKKYQHLF
jgi:hypothetical protein